MEERKKVKWNRLQIVNKIENNTLIETETVRKITCIRKVN